VKSRAAQRIARGRKSVLRLDETRVRGSGFGCDWSAKSLAEMEKLEVDQQKRRRPRDNI